MGEELAAVGWVGEEGEGRCVGVGGGVLREGEGAVLPLEEGAWAGGRCCWV